MGYKAVINFGRIPLRDGCVAQIGSTLTPQRANLLKVIAENSKPNEGFASHSCFLGVCIKNETPQGDTLSQSAIKSAKVKLSTVVQAHSPGINFQWLDDAHGLGLLLGMEEDEFRRVAKTLLEQCQLDLTIEDKAFTINTRIVCTWFPSVLKSSPRFLFDTAEHILVNPRDDSGFQFVAIRSQDAAIEILGRCIDLLSELGLSQKGQNTNRRLNKRIPLKSSCVVRYFRGGTTEIETIKAETQDVSQGGFALFIPRELRIGEIVEIELRKTDGSLFVVGKVTHYQYVSAKKYFIGVTSLETGDEPIISINPEQAMRVFPWLAEFMRARSAKSY